MISSSPYPLIHVTFNFTYIDSDNDAIPLEGTLNKGIVHLLIFVLNVLSYYPHCPPQRKSTASSLLDKTTRIIFKYLLP